MSVAERVGGVADPLGHSKRSSLARLPFLGRLTTLQRLVLGSLVLFALGLAVILTQIVSTYTHSYLSSVDSSLVTEITEFGRSASQRPKGTALRSFAHSYLSSHPLSNGETILIDVFPGPIYGSTDSSSVEPLSRVRQLLDRPPGKTTIFTEAGTGTSYRIIVSPLVNGGKTVGSMVVAANLAQLERQRGEFILLTSLEAVTALAGALAVAAFSLKRILATVQAMTKTAREIAVGDLGTRLRHVGPKDEVGELAATFDIMLDQIESAFNQQSRLVSDLSHQFRTPLTAARGHLELIARGAISQPEEVADSIELVLEELDHLRSLLDRVLLIGRSMEPDFLAIGEVDLATLIRNIGIEASFLANREWRVGNAPEITVRVDGDKVRGAIWNLIDNAIKATSEGDAIGIAVEIGESLDLSVTDSGKGLSPSDQETVFERFARPGGQGRRGTGLGLAIVKAVAEGHGGGVSMRSALGEGATVTISLPLSVIVGPSERSEVEIT